MAGAFVALRSPLFRRVQSAIAVANVGDWFQITGRGVLVYQATGSTTSVGSVYLATYLPQLVLLPVAGLLADRFDRRRFLMATSATQVCAAAVLALVATHRPLAMAAVYAVSFVQGTAQTLAAPTGLAMQPSLVPREAVASAVTVSIAVTNVARVFGPLLAGVVIATIGIAWVFAIASVSYLAVLVTWIVTKVAPSTHTNAERTSPSTLLAGAAYVRARPALWVPVALLSALSGFGLVYQPLGVAFATHVLEHGHAKAGTRVFTEMQAAIGLGAAIGVAATSRLVRRPLVGLVSTGVTFSVALFAFGLAPSPAFAVGVAFVLGAAHYANSNMVLVLVQSAVPDALRGRVMAVALFAWVGTIPVSSQVFGGVASAVGTRATFVGCSLVCLLATLAVLLRRGALPASGEARIDDLDKTLPLLVAEEA